MARPRLLLGCLSPAADRQCRSEISISARLADPFGQVSLPVSLPSSRPRIRAKPPVTM